MSKTHILKCQSTFWDEMAAGRKTFELRFNDRGFAVGDVLELHRTEVDPENVAKFDPLLRRVTYVLPGGHHFGGRVLLDASAVIMGISPITTPKQSPDAQMAEHLREVLESIRDQIAVEIAPDLPKRHALIASMIAQIDEALE